MTTKDKVRFLIIRSVGNFLVLFSIFVVLATFGPALYYEASFRVNQLRGVTYKIQNPNSQADPETKASVSLDASSKNTVNFADILAGPKERLLMPIDADFSILIPKIGANARIFPNTDPSDSRAFLPVLQKGVAHARGTVFPGMRGNIYLFAHSTDNFWNVGRYNAVFYLLKDLGVSDQIVIFFENKRYNYEVTESSVVDPEDVSFITQAQKGTEQLVLQTCWPPGTTWKRLMVFAKPK